MAKYFTKEVKIALTVICAIIVLFVGMNFLKGIIVFSDDVSYKVLMKNINGLSASSPVYADGFQVGVVRDIVYKYNDEEGGIEVIVDVDKQLRIPQGSTAEVESDMMGNLKLNILLANDSRHRIEPGGVIIGGLSAGMMDQVATMLPMVQAMLPKLDSILTNINILVSDPALKTILSNTAQATENLNRTSSQLHDMMAVMEKRMPSIMENADKTLANAQTITGKLSQVDIEGTMASVNATLKNCQNLTNTIQSGEGTLGKLLTDPSLYINLNNTMRDADSLLIDLKARPKRYVHFSLFGSKTK